ncbi:hypothetical protein COU95_00395 [Candidatus Shapirobacteria bacterium CG10_big_fil_rev_8_21_14_0_10_40_9]|uniref:Uncharacterized protein n=1 Tax=Candidatus Shapirobacteria bacterium CG10_big_fil_rev_8_21_14_0_10_40_9 TaxID=1974888 RepID=A0A2M8L4D5_9BACT|nr:MAG: hypothetical protein COU95_00395 [Candidatus Shapirobacteria bacterium CG10_big_fil_rev_8_21_14_0_10_40_9]
MTKEKVLKFFKKTLSHLTLFDWIAVSLVAVIIVVLGIYFLRRWEWVEAEVKISPPDYFWTEKNPPFWLADSLRVGDGEIDSFGRKTAEITDIKAFEVPQNKKSIYLKMRLRAVKDRNKGTYQFKSKQLAVGSPIELRFPRIFLTGVVTFVSGIPDTRFWEDKIVEARLLTWTDVFPETLGVQPWIAEAVKVGDQMKDTQERVVAEVLAKKVAPAEKIVTTDDGRVFVTQDPLKKDVILTLKLKTFKQKGVNYFLDDFKVKVDSDIILALPQIDLYPRITKIVK